MNLEETTKSNFKKYFPYTDKEIIKLGCVVIPEESSVRPPDKTIPIYIFYIKVKWNNFYEKWNRIPKDYELFNMKHPEFKKFYRELLPVYKNPKMSYSARNRKKSSILNKKPHDSTRTNPRPPQR